MTLLSGSVHICPLCALIFACDNSHYEKVGGGEPVCIDDELPFELPDGWVWARFATPTINRDGERRPVASAKRQHLEKIYDYYGASGAIDKVDKYLFEGRLLLIGEDGANLLSRSTPLAFFADGKYWVNNHAHVIDAIYQELLDFLAAFVNSQNLEGVITGTAQPKLTQKALNELLVPIPPLAEQRRIVAALDEYLGLVDEIEQSQAELEMLLAKARSKVLDLAIRGKLVPQDPADEPASVLLERIRAEKLQMVADGRLKKKDVAKDSVIYRGEDNSYYEKVGGGEPVCIDDELPFELPSSWAWSRLVSLCHPQEKPQMAAETFGYIDIDSIDNKRNVVKQPKEMATKNAPSRANRRLRSGATLFSMVRPYLRNIANIDDDLSDCIASTGFYIASPIVEGNLSSWLFLCMRSDCFVDTINRQMRGDNSPSVRKDEMDSMLIPLPPESEQIRAFELAQRVLTLLEDW